MGLNNKSYKGNIAGVGEFATLFVTWFLSTFFFTVLALGARAAQGINALPDLPVMPAIVIAAAFMVATHRNINVTGGFLYWSHMLATLIVGTIVRIVVRSSNTRSKLYKHADRQWMNLDWSRALTATFAQILAFILGSAVIYSFAGSDIEFILHAPGPFPGPGVVAPLQAFFMELLGAAALGWVLTFYALSGYSPISEGGDGKNKEYKKGVKLAAYLLAGVIAISWNYSGGCFDAPLWVVEHFVVAVILGNPLFAGTIDFWWVYIFGNLSGWVIGVSLGYVSRSIDSTVDYEVMENAGERDAVQLLKSRVGNRSNINGNSGRQAGKRTAADVDKLAIATGLFGDQSD